MPNNATSTLPQPTIDALLNILPTPDGPHKVLAQLASHPALAAHADVNGYTLLHAASSYAALDVLKTLVNIYDVDPNVKDLDGDTPLFYAETVEVARCMVVELGADAKAVNHEGRTVIANARANAEDGEPGWEAVADYLQSWLSVNASNETAAIEGENGTGSERPPPPLPSNVKVNVGTMSADDLDAAEAGEADPEFKARIDALAARGDFGEESGQKDLRALVEEAVGGLEGNESAIGGSSKRRAG